MAHGDSLAGFGTPARIHLRGGRENITVVDERPGAGREEALSELCEHDSSGYHEGAMTWSIPAL